jgi:lactate permease
VDSLFGTWLIALVPVAVLLIFLALLRVSAWRAAMVGCIITFLLAWLVWRMPPGLGAIAFFYGALTGIWNVDWITFWGVVLFNTLVATGVFDRFRRWLIAHGTQDVRAQTILFAWAFGAMLEGLVGFGYPWAVVAPILISLGIPDIEALRVAAIANNAPVSFGALGSPIIGLAAVAGVAIAPHVPQHEVLMHLSASVGRVVAILALLPPWLLIYLVSGRQGLKDGWPLALVGSLGYIAGQYPVAVYLGPYLPDLSGAIVCFAAVFVLLKVWHPRQTLGFGGKPLGPDAATPPLHGLTRWQIVEAWMPFLILIAVVVAWTGPWSPLPRIVWFTAHIDALSSVIEGGQVAAMFRFAPFIGGTAILCAWIVIALALRTSPKQIRTIFTRTAQQMWGALLVGAFIFGLAFVYNFSGMASSLAYAFSKLGWSFLIVSPILGCIGVALSGSNTATNAMFGAFQAIVGKLLGFPALLTPTLNTVGAELGKAMAPQTASVGVSTSRFVRNEGVVIRHNFLWSLLLLGYLVLIGVACYYIIPGMMEFPES